MRDGTTRKGGRLPVDPSGGLTSEGHPIGATGVPMHGMAAMQLCGEMQIAGATRAGVFNLGGAAVANHVSILERTRRRQGAGAASRSYELLMVARRG